MEQQFTLKNAFFTAQTAVRGAELISFQDQEGNEFIWNGDPAYWTGRNPILFPIVGNLKNGKIHIGGVPYEMNRHGFARTQDFAVKEKTEDSITFLLKENEETLSRYPFLFSFEVCHRLTDIGFSTSFTVENTGGVTLPFCVGAHTAFHCPLPGDDTGSFTDYELVFDEIQTAENLLLTPQGIFFADKRGALLKDSDRLSLDYEIFRQLDTIVYDGLRSKSVALRNKNTGRGVRMDYEGFPMIAFWTKPGAPYLCLEPWHGCAAFENETGEFADKPHCVLLPPGEKKTLSFSVSLLK